ncbi:MAG: hypothetical protein PHE53_12620 [Thermoguttaceae bacterium]|nr:hypothetical protein [Thermoguttaceae bacterium]
MRNLDRRCFLQSTSLLGASLLLNRSTSTFAETELEPSTQWYRGNLHLHTQWSDGSPMPEWVVAWYKEKGYHFICTSDHNTFQSDTLQFNAWCGACETPKDLTAFEKLGSRWKQVMDPAWGRLTQVAVDQAAEKFGSDSLTSIVDADRKLYRLKTFDELSAQFSEPGKFLLFPSFEQTGQSQDRRQVHMNFINVRTFFPYIEGKNVQDTVDRTFDQGKELYHSNPEPYMFTLNHPIWPYYDVEPQTLIDNPAIRFCELNNNGLEYDRHPQGWDPEKFWDVANAFRVAAGQPLVLATGSDDEHSYTRKTPKAWIMVRAERLDFPSLYAAMERGDSYTSNGLDFETITFDRGNGKLSVKVKAEPNTSYRIEFFGTKKDFDRTCTWINVPEDKHPARSISSWSDQIGQRFQSVDGTGASYTLAEDDLYVRARVTKITDTQEYQEKYQLLLYPAAWTQPYSMLVR